jgi:hypothetical protein
MRRLSESGGSEMGLRLWADPDTGEIIGWPGAQNRYRGVRTYLFVVEEAQLQGAIVRHTIGYASLRLANGTRLDEVVPQSRAQPEPYPGLSPSTRPTSRNPMGDSRRRRRPDRE